MKQRDIIKKWSKFDPALEAAKELWEIDVRPDNFDWNSNPLVPNPFINHVYNCLRDIGNNAKEN